MTEIGSDVVAARIDDWRRRLIDLSHRNRLIAYRPTQATTLTIAAPAVRELLAEPDRAAPWSFFFPPEEETIDNEETSEAATTVDELVVSSQKRTLERRPNEIEVTEPSAKRIARILDNLAKRSNTEFQDKALRILYIAAGFLDWRDEQREKDITSPLVLVPVELRRGSTRDPYRLYFIDDEDIVINPSLTEKLRRDAGLGIPGDWIWEDKPITQELDEIRQAVAGTGWTVREQAVIGLFSFQKYVMYRDLLDHQERVGGHPVVASLARGGLIEDLRDADPDVPEVGELDQAQAPAETLSFLDADASQRQCVEAAKRGQSFVMQGPPGTGKSQTIANVIAEAIGQGKSVLFVSEKAAALDVVHRRLAASGLDEYCLMLHGEHAGRREVVQGLDRSLSTALEARAGMRADEMERLANLRTLLNDSAELLHLPQQTLGGRSLREIHEELAELHDAPSVPGSPEASPKLGEAVLDEQQALTEVFQRLSERWHVSAPDYLWRDYDSERFTADDHGRVVAVVRRLAADTKQLAVLSAAVARALGIPSPRSLAESERLAEISHHLQQAPALEGHWLELSNTTLADAVDAAERAYRELEHANASYREELPARSHGDYPANIASRLEEARDAVRRVAGWSEAWRTELGELPGCLRSLEEIPGLTDRVRDRSLATARLLGQPEQSRTADALDQLAELAELTFVAELRPERDWLVRPGLDRARLVLDEIASDVALYQDQIAKLLEYYTPEALALDAGGMVERFTTEYTSVFSRLSGAYRRDAKAIKAARTDGKLAPSLVDELKLLAATQDVGVRIDEAAGRMNQALGSYAAGRDTDLAATRQALKIAERVIALSDAETDIDVLGERIAIGSQPDPEVAQAADRLRDAKTRLVSALVPLERFIATSDGLFRGTLEQLSADTARFERPLRVLAELISDLDTGARARADSFADLERRAALIGDLHVTHARIDQESPGWTTVVGAPFAGGETDFEAVRAAAGWLTELRTLIDDGLSQRVTEQLRAERRRWPDFDGLRAGCHQLRETARSFAMMFGQSRGQELEHFFESERFEALQALAGQMSETIDELGDWTEWRAWRKRAVEARWGPFVDGLIEGNVGATAVLPAFRRAYWNQRLELLYEKEPDLRDDLRGGAFQRWVEEFRELDLMLVRTGADRLIARRERARGTHVSTPGSEVDLLRREARKKRRHLPVRVLLARIPKLLSELKPCMMMSPLTVSHFLAPHHSFDLVVFDEASQVPPQDAINCIYRGSQLIVAGDSKQLPPTPFFQIAELDELAPEEEDASTQEDMESVLDACETLLPSHSLRWHYRSRSEPLIAFSNERIYNGSLVTFPSADTRSKQMGIRFVYVPDGVYDRGRTATNRREAKIVARRVVHYLTDGSGRSVGVIGFNSTQANAIAEELDLIKVHHPELEPHFRGDRLDGVFVKHLEAVQGDEREVIIFSVGYGPDAKGKFTMNFGPLNKEGGQRRLNVAITRARERVEVVASVRAHDFRLADGASAGARLLRDYLAFAEAEGREGGESASEQEQTWQSPLEKQVAATVGELGYDATPEVGAGRFRIDIGVQARNNRDRFLLGIECDGDSYLNTPTARDRERLRHEVLHALGWGPIHRIWSLDWVRNRAGETERLKKALESAEARSDHGNEGATGNGAPTESRDLGVPHERTERVVYELASAATAAELPWTETYVRATLRQRKSFYDFHDSVNRGPQTNTLVELLQVEAPISIDYAIRRVAEAWGLQRAGHRVMAAGRQSIGQAKRRGDAEIRGDFLWRLEQALTHVRVPDPADQTTRRDIDDIPPEEIDLAIARLREASAGVSDEQIVVQVTRILGFDRTGERIRVVLKKRLAAINKRAREAG